MKKSLIYIILMIFLLVSVSAQDIEGECESDFFDCAEQCSSPCLDNCEEDFDDCTETVESDEECELDFEDCAIACDDPCVKACEDEYNACNPEEEEIEEEGFEPQVITGGEEDVGNVEQGGFEVEGEYLDQDPVGPVEFRESDKVIETIDASEEDISEKENIDVPETDGCGLLCKIQNFFQKLFA